MRELQLGGIREFHDERRAGAVRGTHGNANKLDQTLLPVILRAQRAPGTIAHACIAEPTLACGVEVRQRGRGEMRAAAHKMSYAFNH
jgi:hypothetical protein